MMASGSRSRNQAQRGAIKRRAAFNRVALFLDLREFRERHVRAGSIRLPDQTREEQKLRGLLVRKWPEQHSIHHAENGGVGANSQRQRQDGNQGEAGVLPQHAQREFQVLHQSQHGAPRTESMLILQP